MELTTYVNLVVGDLSGDGHGQTSETIFLTTPELASSVQQAYKAGCKHFDWSENKLSSYCAGYGENEIPFAMVDTLVRYYMTDPELQTKLDMPEICGYEYSEKPSDSNEQSPRGASLHPQSYLFLYRLILIAGNRDYLHKFEPISSRTVHIGGYGLFHV